MIISLDGNAIIVNEGQVVTAPARAQGYVVGEAQDNDAYRATAARLGYGGDTVMLNIEHEITHSLLAHWLGMPCSPVMLKLASGDERETVGGGLEEDAVLAIQRFARHCGVELIEVLQKAGRRV